VPVAAELYYSLYQETEKNTLPVVLLHGAAGNHLSWAADIRRLKGYRVYALDLPGHAKSESLGGQQTIAGFASNVIEWLAAVGLARAVFVGHSLGGAIALELGLNHPEYVLGLGLVSTGVRLRVDPELLELASRSATFQKAIDKLVANSFSSQTPARLVELAAQRMADTRPSVFHGDLMACNEFDVKEQVTSLKRPSVVIVGTQDQMTPVRYAQFMADTIPGAQLRIIPEAGHMVILEQPGQVAAALREFLQTIVYSPGEEA
jgi:pimeloyl-ACP methyl ester carboxylesterase